MKISIAMATYNGERFLQEQLDSLAAQTHLPCELVVGDDGSIDGTLNILERFAAKAPFPVHIHRNPTNLGYGENFLQTASRCTGDWIAFCDQDDVWLHQKLARACNIRNRNPKIGLIVHELVACDQELRPISMHVNGILVSHRRGTLKGVHRVFAGCSMVFDKSLLDTTSWKHRPHFADLNKQLPHDSWIGLLAYASCGQFFERKPLVLYRRHESAVTGDYTHSLSDRLSRVRTTSASHFRIASARYYDIARGLRSNSLIRNTQIGTQLLNASAAVERQAQLFLRRAELYETGTLAGRVRRLFSLYSTSDYLILFGVRDHVKDFLRAVAS